VETTHRPSCSLARGAPASQEWNVGVLYTGLQRLFNIALIATFSLRYGSGGASFAPVFRYYPLVDSRKSPAFRVLELVTDALAVTHTFANDMDKEKVMHLRARVSRHGAEKLRRIFDGRVASPLDVDLQGNSLGSSFFRDLVSGNSKNEPPIWKPADKTK
jgi:hypothetical protein